MQEPLHRDLSGLVEKDAFHPVPHLAGEPSEAPTTPEPVLGRPTDHVRPDGTATTLERPTEVDDWFRDGRGEAVGSQTVGIAEGDDRAQFGDRVGPFVVAGEVVDEGDQELLWVGGQCPARTVGPMPG